MSRCSYKTDGTYLCDMVETFAVRNPCTNIKKNCKNVDGQFIENKKFCWCRYTPKPISGVYVYNRNKKPEKPKPIYYDKELKLLKYYDRDF